MGRVYDDANEDLTYDAGDTGEVGIPVRLMSGSSVVATTMTHDGGVYWFDNIPDGTYSVQIDDVPYANVDAYRDWVPVTSTVDNFYTAYVTFSAASKPTGIDFPLQADLDGPLNPEDPEASPPISPPPAPPPAAQHGMNWSTAIWVEGNVPAYGNSGPTGSVWLVSTFSGKVIRCWSGYGNGQTSTFFCHGNTFGGLGVTVTQNSQQVVRNLSPFSGKVGDNSVADLLVAEYDLVVKPTEVQNGDVIAFRDADGAVIHTAIVTKATISGPSLDAKASEVKTKNGLNLDPQGQDKPWTEPLAQLMQEYAKSKVVRNGNRVDLPTTVEFYRLKK